MNQENQKFDSITGVLRKAFQVEVDGFTFYSMTAERVTRPAVRRLFDSIRVDFLPEEG